ncbi:MAG: rhodanese-like domain-containing protein [Verrucomicrobiales bacterium]|jgi:rhodanese-related sulfurtransferase|nr:rhodanese-like domain-containing protein [Verrucomicrobiales bacterium]
MKKWLLRFLAGFGLFAIGWHVFEYAWDQNLFSQSETMEVVNVSAKEAAALLEGEEGVQPIDVRPEKSFVSGHLPGAIRVKYGRGELDHEAAKPLDRSRPLLVYCDGGFRSRLSLGAFEAEGFEKIYHLHRGMLSWRLQGMPCENSVEDLESKNNRTDL